MIRKDLYIKNEIERYEKLIEKLKNMSIAELADKSLDFDIDEMGYATIRTFDGNLFFDSMNTDCHTGYQEAMKHQIELLSENVDNKD